VKLKLEEWRSGDILWVVEAVGDGKIMEPMLGRLVANEWKGKTARMRVRANDGAYKVGLLSHAPVDAALQTG
jgi:hemolysin-activating ACP:hemolysin acyltransferase